MGPLPHSSSFSISGSFSRGMTLHQLHEVLGFMGHQVGKIFGEKGGMYGMHGFDICIYIYIFVNIVYIYIHIYLLVHIV